MKLFKTGFAITVLFAFLISGCNSERSLADVVHPANIFSDNMVLQREKPITIWGKATPNSTLRVVFNKQEKRVRAQADSTWQVDLGAEEAGGPFRLTISGKDTLVYNNVMVGEVWVCSGQSNMEMPLAGWGEIINYKQEIAEANYPEIRLRTIERSTFLVPQSTATFDSWEECSPSTIEDFSATAYSKRSLDTMKLVVDDYKRETEIWYDQLKIREEEIEKEFPGMATMGLNDADWAQIDLPQPWKDVVGGLGQVDGVVWFRKTFTVKARDLKSDEFEISLGYIHDKNSTYINGTLIGESETRWGSDITSYTIPAGIIKPGINTLAIRITNYEWIGGICRDKESLWVKNGSGFKVSLTGPWKYQMVLNFNELPKLPVSPINANEPAVLYNGMIEPLVKTTIRGAIWYQGESNAGRPLQYRTISPMLIESWRAKWDQGDFPFYYVQLANYMERNTEPQSSNWAALREAQSMALSLPNTGQAVAIDIGNAEDIHPKNKQEVGRRLALNALNLTYGMEIVYSGPVYNAMETMGDTIKLQFAHTGSGLMAKDSDQIHGFSIAGEDKHFLWAEAKIMRG